MAASKTNLRRHLARCCAVQALYQWQHTQHNASEILQQFAEDDLLQGVDRAYLSELVNGTIAEQIIIDELLLPQLDRPLTQLNPVELAVLRVAIYELQHFLQVPYRVVLNEALEITKKYGAVQGYKYVNAVLHRLAPKLREAEKKD